MYNRKNTKDLAVYFDWLLVYYTESHGERIDVAKHALKPATSTLEDRRYCPTIIRFATHHIRDHANTEREVITVPSTSASLTT